VYDDVTYVYDDVTYVYRNDLYNADFKENRNTSTPILEDNLNRCCTVYTKLNTYNTH